MEINIPLFQDCSLKIETHPMDNTNYPTTMLQKGLLLVQNGQNLAEEAIGFGVPILKQGIRTFFAGDVELTSCHNGNDEVITAKFNINLEERIGKASSKSVENNFVYYIKNVLAATHRHFPIFRGLLTETSNFLRKIFNLVTTYDHMDFSTKVKMIYTVHPDMGRIHIDLERSNFAKDNITEVIVMNEQGGHHFNCYSESNGIHLKGNEIGTWDIVTANEASFISSIHQLTFTLTQVKGATLFRGRELVDSRLAWSGFGYSIPPSAKRFSYNVKIKRIL